MLAERRNKKNTVSSVLEHSSQQFVNSSSVRKHSFNVTLVEIVAATSVLNRQTIDLDGSFDVPCLRCLPLTDEFTVRSTVREKRCVHGIPSIPLYELLFVHPPPHI